MTAQRSGQSADPVREPMVKEGALIANFYGQQGKLQPLVDHLAQALGLLDQGHGSYANEESGTLLRSFEPVAISVRDTTVIQLALNASGAVGAAWEGLRTRLEGVLSSTDLDRKVWGYTLIYQAELVEGVSSRDVLPGLLASAQRLHPVMAQHSQVLGKSDMPGGQLWLIDLPLQGDGGQAATVYLALSQSHSNNRLVREVLYNPVASLLMVDLLAHRGYHQMRQYRLGGLDKRYRDNLEVLSNRTDYLLNNLGQVSVTSGELDRLAGEYSLLVGVIKDLDLLRISLVRQKFNFDWWRKQADGDDIVEFHYSHLENGAQELELLVAEGQHPLEAAKTAVDILQARLDKRQEGRQQRLETILSVVAVVFSILALVDKETAQALLGSIDATAPVGIWPELAVQLVCIVIFSLLAVLVVRLVRRVGRS